MGTYGHLALNEDFFLNGQAVGSLAQMFAANMDPGLKRPFLWQNQKTGRWGKWIETRALDPFGNPIYERDEKGQIIALETHKSGYVKKKVKKSRSPFVGNALLTYDQWKEIDREVLGIYHLRTPGVQDLLNRGLRYDIPNALGTTVLQWQTASDLPNAFLDMDARSQGSRDRQKYLTNYLPLPIAHQEFELSIREMSMATLTQGASLDVSHSREATITVTELLEDMLFNGRSTYTWGGGTIYGYTDHPNRATVAMGTSWATDTGPNILLDVRAMIQDLVDNRRYGPYGLYVSTNIQVNLERPYDDTYPVRSIREMILAIGAGGREGDQGTGRIEFIHTADKLAASTAVLIDLTRESVEMVVGFEPRTIQWQELGGMTTIFKVLAIMVPRIRADQGNRTGVCVCS